MKRSDKAKKRFKQIEGIWGFVSDLIDIFSMLFSSKVGLTLLVIGGVGAGGYFGYQSGFTAGVSSGKNSVICEPPKECEVCAEPVVCPEAPDCPEPQRPIENYTCEEINAIKVGECACVPF